MRLTLWQKLESFPPIACRLLARIKTPTGGVRAMTTLEIAERSGLTEADVNSLSWRTSWDEVQYKQIRAFTEGCGVNLTDRAIARMQAAYIRRGAAYKYLKKSSEWLSLYKPMILLYVKSRRTPTS